MELNWNLDELYKSENSDEFNNDMSNYKQELDELTSFAENNFNSTEDAANKIETFINMKNKIAYYDKLFIYVNLSLSTNTSNENLNKISDKLEGMESESAKSNSMFQQFLKQIDDINSVIEKSEVLKEHCFIINELKNSSKYVLSPNEESTISKMKNTGSLMWKKLWEQLTSSLCVEIEQNGEIKQFSLSEIRNMAYSDNKEIRKKAYTSEINAYKKIETACSFALNGIKGEVINLSKIRGYNSPLEMTAINSRMDLKIIETMFSAIEEFIPESEKYFKRKAELLGHKKALPFYDLFAPIGSINDKYSYEETKETVIQNFYKFSDKMGSYAENAFNKNWIDVYPQEGKVSGAFCESVHPIKQSRILINFGGTFSDIITIAHELGHAYHDSCLYSETPLNSFYPMPIAETASTFCETLVTKNLLENSLNDRIKILENSISDAVQVIVDIYSRFLFEDEVFKKRIDGILSANELNEIMLSSQLKAYGNGLDKNYMHKYMWICKPHYYDADFNYYNFPYAFGLLFSKSLFSKYMENKKDFIQTYDNILNNTGKNNLSEIGRLSGIDLYSKEFWKSGLKEIKDDIDKFIDLSGGLKND